MNVIALRTLRDFWERHPQAKGPLSAWYLIARQADWNGPADIRAMFNSADFLADDRVVFDIAGNKYRLIVRISYPYKRVQVKFVGTHAEYDRVDAKTVR
jgi:mRNA interferase HigB